MGRVERFRQNRQTRRRITAAVTVFLVIMITGIAVADYSISCIMMNQDHIEIISAKEINGSFIQISFMNQKYYINTKYIKRDYNRLKEFAKNKLGK
ncbi:MAG: hypothetical protein N2484_11345 [Clostridia bacterium]|nr:hypothetical protein [Clostridia bacterium]